MTYVLVRITRTWIQSLTEGQYVDSFSLKYTFETWLQHPFEQQYNQL